MLKPDEDQPDIQQKIEQMKDRSHREPVKVPANIQEQQTIHYFTMKQAAKQFDIDPRALFSILRKNSYFIKLGNRNLPIPELIEKGYFNNKINDFRNGKISVHYIQTYVTANGMSFLAKLIQKQNEKK